MAHRTSGSSGGRSNATRKRYGKTLPRLFTPPLAAGEPGPCGCGCALTEATSLGFDAVWFAGELLHMTLFPWQRWLLIHGLEIVPDEEFPGLTRFRFRKLVVLVGRQNGKSTLSVVLSLWAMYRLGVGTVLGTAQDLDTAEEVWSRAVDLVEETKELPDGTEVFVRPDLHELVKQIGRTNGKYALVLKTDSRYKIKAANRRAGRGFSAELILLDELREHETWEAWSAITKTTNAKRDAQIWCLSNAGDAKSVVLRHLRLIAHRELGDPDGEISRDERQQDEFDALFAEQMGDEPELVKSLADIAAEDDGGLGEDDAESIFLAEWSATPECNVLDPEEWAQSNPSLGYMTSIRTIAGDAKNDPEWVFRTEVLCQWPRGNIEGPFDADLWERTLNHVVETAAGPTLADEDRIVGRKVATVAVAHDRSRAHVVFSGHRADGKAQAVVVESMRGVEGIRPWLEAHRDEILFVTGQERGAQESQLLADWRDDPTFVIPVTPCGGQNLTAALGTARDLLRTGMVRHNPQPVLDVPAATAVTKELGGGNVINLGKSPGDASPVQAWAIGLHMLSRPAQKAAAIPVPPRIRRVSRSGIMTRDF